MVEALSDWHQFRVREAFKRRLRNRSSGFCGIYELEEVILQVKEISGFESIFSKFHLGDFIVVRSESGNHKSLIKSEKRSNCITFLY
ncbi:hypothetical protein V2J09_009591 [Rumex salicifolius]